MKAEAVKKQVDYLEPFLKQTMWAPMTYMLIPSLLNFRDDYLQKIELTDDVTVQEQYQRLKKLRENFKRCNSNKNKNSGHNPHKF